MKFLFVFIVGLFAAEENIASEGEASQSDSYFDDKGGPGLAIDGNTNGNFDDGSVTHTGLKGKRAFWTLKFSKTYYVTKIQVWNRIGKFTVGIDLFDFDDRLNGAILRLDGGEKNILVTLNADMGNPIVIDVNDEVERVTIIGGQDHLSLAEVEVFGYAQDKLPKFENVAAKGRASQSDTFIEPFQDIVWVAQKAIDGNTNSDHTDSFTHTDSQGKAAWWRLDFDESYYVSKIRIWNRYVHSERLTGVTVRINDQSDILATLVTPGMGNPVEIMVDGSVKSIMINGGNSYLSLAEVEVFARAALKNIAGEGEASQSDDKSKKKWKASAAIDGNTEGQMKKKSVARTKSKGVDAFWKLDFSETYYVSTIKIWSSTDKCCAKRLDGATVRLDGGRKNILATLNTEDTNPVVIDVKDGVNRITITASGKNFLAVAEVEVFGFAHAGFTALKNVAAEGEASQKDNFSGNKGLARLAIDGDTDGRFKKKKESVTQTKKKGKSPWWRLDFSETYYASQIRIWNRVDKCCSKWLKDALVKLEGGRKNILVKLDTKEGNPIVINVDDALNRLTITGTSSSLSLAEVEVFGYVEVSFTPTNVASEGTASQSDNYFVDHGFAQSAIDGNSNGNYDGGSVTHTKSTGLDAYWMLDFSTTYYVTQIKIWNRHENAGRLNGATVRLGGGDKNMVVVLDIEMGNPIVIDVEDALNRITITGGNDHLSLAEVEVFGYANPGLTPINNNIASEGTASQTDNYYSDQAFANAAIDGNTDGRLGRGSVTHTSARGRDAVWKLEFSESYYVTKIHIWNRIDDHADRLNGAILRLDGGKMNIIATLNRNMGNPIVIEVNDEVELVTITAKDDHLSLAEVEVYGYAQDDLPNFENVAPSGTASQSDTWNSDHVAQVAIDGNTNGDKSFTHTTSQGNAAWWKLDFDESYYVSKIRVWNRVSNDDRLNGVTLRINDKAEILATLSTAGAGNPVEIKVEGDVKSIMINGGNSYLSLAEVEVFAVA